MKRPSFQFYPADWMKDLGLRSCSIAARGMWADMLCLANESDPYGHLVINGKPMTNAQIVNSVRGATQKLLHELESAGVFSRAEDGAVYSRRMVRDEALRLVRAAGGESGAGHGSKGGIHGAKGGRPRKHEGGNKPPLVNETEPPLKPTPSSSSSSSSSKNLQTLRRVEPDGFRRFWSAYPATRRRVAKVKCLAVWVGQGLESTAEAIIGHVEAMKPTPQWREGYEPAPLTYLNQRRWEDGLPVPERKRGPSL